MPKRRIRKMLNIFVAASLPAIFLVMALKAAGQVEPGVVRAAGPGPEPHRSSGIIPTPEMGSAPATAGAGQFILPSDFRKLEISRELNHLLVKYRADWSEKDKSDVVETLLDIESEYGFKPDLFLRLMEVESNFKIRAVSKDGARGLCQVQPETARHLSRTLGQPPIPEEMLFDPVLNLRLSAAYLSFLENKYKALPKAVSAYNMGPGAFSRVYGEGGIPKGRYHDLLTR